jgi:uncharacterized membrane protein YccC
MIPLSEFEPTSEPQSHAGQSTHPEILVSAVLHLMSHYTTNSALNSDHRVCIKLAAVIERHLKILSDLPELAPVLRATCQQLCEPWAQVVDNAIQQQTKTPFLISLQKKLN